MPTQFTSPVGRIVQGDCFVGSDKDQQGNPRLVKSGPNIGKPMMQWFVGLAFAKVNAQGYANPEWAAFKALIDAEAAASWPSLHPGGVRIPGVRFSDKIIDGDGYDESGKPWNTREGFAGHWVVRFSSGFAPKCFPTGRHAPADMITDPSLLRRGYYARIAGNLQSNDNAQKPGLYVNMSLIELAGWGPEIISGPDAGAAFSAPVTLPVGASAVPLAPPAGAPPPPPGAAAPPPPPPAAAPPPPPAPAAPPPPPAPAAPPPPPAAPYSGYRQDAAPARVMLAAANGQTYEGMIAAGWTDATLVQHGMMAAPTPAAPPPAPAAPPPPPAPAAPPPPPAGKTLAAGVAGTYESWIAAGWTDEQLIAAGKMAA